MRAPRAAAVALLLASVTGSAPAHADLGAVAFTGTMYIGCAGCGNSTATATLQVDGATVGRGAIVGAADATMDLYESASGPSCIANGSVRNGVMTGALAVRFAWTRLGHLALVTTRGEIDGHGVAAIHVTSPSGVWCGAENVTADIAGVIVGF